MVKKRRHSKFFPRPKFIATIWKILQTTNSIDYSPIYKLDFRIFDKRLYFSMARHR